MAESSDASPNAPGATSPVPSGTQAAPSLRSDARKLGTNSLIYMLPTIAARGVNFVVTPIYTRLMSASDYAIVGLAATISPLVTYVLCMSVHSAILRLHFDYPDERERKRLYSTITIFLAVVPALIAGILEVCGSFGLFDHALRSVTYTPHLRLMLWSGMLGVFPGIYSNIYIAREDPRRVTARNVFIVFVTVGCGLFFTAVLHQGAVGLLRANLISAIVIAIFTFVSVLRMSGVSFSWSHLRAALIFGIPIVPHQLLSWVLSASDRIILDRSVSKQELGCYSLACTLCSVIPVVSAAVSGAFSSIANRRFQSEGVKSLPQLGTMAIVPVVFIGMGVALVGGDFVRWIMPVAYHRTADVLPWIALGYTLQGLFVVASLGSYLSKKTGLVPFATLFAGLANVGLNLALVPRLGINIAAINMTIGYGIFALSHTILSHRNLRIAWDYWRWVLLLVCAAVTWFVGGLVFPIAPVWGFFAKGLWAVVAFPVLMYATGFIRKREVDFAMDLIRSRMGKKG